MPASLDQLEVVFISVLQVALAGVGLTCMIMLLVGGFGFLTAGGDKEATQKAQRMLTYGLIGLLVAFSAWIIINFLGNFLGLNFTVFNLCFPPSVRVPGIGCVP